MRIAYLGQMADVATENGISKKIQAQAARWIGAGHTVRYFSLVPTADVWPHLAPLEAELVTRGVAGMRAIRSLELARRIRAWRPDVIYFRYAYHSAGLPALFRDIPTIAEINSDDLAEYPITLTWRKLWYHRLTRLRVLRSLAACVAVTGELAQRFAALGRPTEVIANGIDLAAFPTARAADDDRLRLVFVGSAGTPWHGLERVAELAQLFPDLGIDVIGHTADDAARSSHPGNLRFLGVQRRAEYEPMLRSATAAIGTMALYRKKMDEACPLKVREYLAFGLPVIAAYRDTDIPPDAGYFLRLPNDDTPLAQHRELIAAWLTQWRGRRVPREQIAHLDNSAKEAQRLAFMTRIVALHPASA